MEEGWGGHAGSCRGPNGAQGPADPWAQAQLDPNRDGSNGTTADARYLTLALGNFFRFFVSESVDDSAVAVGNEEDIVVEVRLLDRESNPATGGAQTGGVQTGVRIEFEYTGAYEVATGTEGGTAASTGHWLTNARDMGDGYFHVAVHPVGGWGRTGAINVAVLVETTDAAGSSEAGQRIGGGRTDARSRRASSR